MLAKQPGSVRRRKELQTSDWDPLHSVGNCFIKKEKIKVGIVPYALLTYGLTIVISLAVVAVIVITNNIINKKSKKKEAE